MAQIDLPNPEPIAEDTLFGTEGDDAANDAVAVRTGARAGTNDDEH